MNSQTPLPVDIDVLSVKKMQEEGERFVLLDVREPEEFATATIEGSLQIPMRTVPSRLADLESHRGSGLSSTAITAAAAPASPSGCGTRGSSRSKTWPAALTLGASKWIQLSRGINS